VVAGGGSVWGQVSPLPELVELQTKEPRPVKQAGAKRLLGQGHAQVARFKLYSRMLQKFNTCSETLSLQITVH
jgi:hypothetical protein